MVLSEIIHYSKKQVGHVTPWPPTASASASIPEWNRKKDDYYGDWMKREYNPDELATVLFKHLERDS